MSGRNVTLDGFWIWKETFNKERTQQQSTVVFPYFLQISLNETHCLKNENQKTFSDYQFFVKQRYVQGSFNDKSYLKDLPTLKFFGISKLIYVNFNQCFYLET